MYIELIQWRLLWALGIRKLLSGGQLSKSFCIAPYARMPNDTCPMTKDQSNLFWFSCIYGAIKQDFCHIKAIFKQLLWKFETFSFKDSKFLRIECILSFPSGTVGVGRCFWVWIFLRVLRFISFSSHLHLKQDNLIKYPYFVKYYLEQFASISDTENWTTTKKTRETWFQITHDNAIFSSLF